MAKAPSNIEREHKYLVRETPAGLSKYKHRLIRQGYLAIGEEGRQARVREIRNGTAKAKYILGVKAGKGRVRREVEFEVSRAEFARLWPLTKGHRLEKVRYDIPLGGGLVAELDVYRGRLRGLRVAEVEFDSERQRRSFEPPAWFGKQVDGVRRYSNTYLARFGLSEK